MIMKREIKFRGKSIDNRKIVIGYYNQDPEDGHFITDFEYVNVPGNADEPPSGYFTKNTNQVIPETLGQYTGLKDKNGVEIYEGDIVKGIFNIRTGTRSNGRGRNAYTVAVYTDIEVTGIIVFKEELASFYFETDFKQEYLSSFWRGCGRTKAERDANYLTTTYSTPKDYLHKVVKQIEIVGNIHKNPELLNKPI